jgi:Tfp pilus assembly protein PilE
MKKCRAGLSFDAIYNRAAFTLSEVMVALVLLTIVTQAVYSFYTIGVKTYRRSQLSADTVGSVRYLKKIIEEKLSFKSNNNFSVFMKKNGMSTLSGFKNILCINAEGPNLPLYTALGFGDYIAHPGKNIQECTMEAVIKKMSGLGRIYNSEFSGNYIAELNKNAASISGPSARFEFSVSHPPAAALGFGFLEPSDSVKVTTSHNSSLTAEINSSDMKDIAFLFSGAPPASAVNMNITVQKQDASLKKIFSILASFDSKTAPSITPGTNIQPADYKFYFVTGSNLFCDDGMLFYEQDINDRFINHAFYVKTPETDEAELDSDGNVLKEIRYAFARESEGWKFIDDTIISNVESVAFTYYDKDANEVACDKNFWQWHKGDQVYSVNIDVTTKKEDVKENFKMVIEL